MKRLTIIMLTLLLLGCLSAYAQKTASGDQEKPKMITAVQVDPTNRAANQPDITEPLDGTTTASVSSKNTGPVSTNALPPAERDAKTPDPEATRTNTQAVDNTGTRTAQNNSMQGPSAKDDPEEVKPDEK